MLKAENNKTDLPQRFNRVPSPKSTKHLMLYNNVRFDPSGVLCLVLVHNEIKIIRQFFDYYRSIGVAQFVAVDDGSNDGTLEFLLKQKDCVVFTPREWTNFREDKGIWRAEILDQLSEERWALLPDTDEHFVHRVLERQSVNELCRLLDDEGSQAVFTTMVDMYADKALSEQDFLGGNLIDTYPFFDSPNYSVAGYRLLPPAKRFLKQYPTPAICAYGGVRDRMFFSNAKNLNFFERFVLNRYANINRPLQPNYLQKFANSIARKVSKRHFGKHPFSMTKLGLIKWQKGMRLSGPPHAVSAKITLSRSTGVFLHYKFVGGVQAFEYHAKRGQHVGGSVLYKEMLEQSQMFDVNPVFEGTRRYDGPRSLIACGLLRV